MFVWLEFIYMPTNTWLSHICFCIINWARRIKRLSLILLGSGLSTMCVVCIFSLCSYHILLQPPDAFTYFLCHLTINKIISSAYLSCQMNRFACNLRQRNSSMTPLSSLLSPGYRAERLDLASHTLGAPVEVA